MVNIFHALPELPQLYWLIPTQFYADKASQILATWDIWADEKSRRLFEAFIELRQTGDYRVMPNPEPHQYFPTDIPQWRTPLRLIDGGAFDGDTLRTVEELKIPAEAVAAFEPDHKNYDILVRQRHSHYFSKIDVTLWPCGVYGRTTQLRFSSGLGAASCISTGGEQVIQCVAIDDALSGFSPNLVKMDIEGAEYDALNGAAKTIEECRPGIAVCVYHHPEDIWRIPALLKGWDLGYRFYLRSHAYSAFDTVLYAMI
jgi:FkbM family methyltransferase